MLCVNVKGGNIYLYKGLGSSNIFLKHCQGSPVPLHGAVAEADDSPSSAKATPVGVRGKHEAQDPLFVKQERFCF